MTDPTVTTIAWASTGLAAIIFGVIIAPYLWRRFTTWLDQRVTELHQRHHQAMTQQYADALDAELHDMADGH